MKRNSASSRVRNRIAGLLWEQEIPGSSPGGSTTLKEGLDESRP
jgi:hypothetical protein